jgi:hypothetical protein
MLRGLTTAQLNACVMFDEKFLLWLPLLPEMGFGAVLVILKSDD